MGIQLVSQVKPAAYPEWTFWWDQRWSSLLAKDYHVWHELRVRNSQIDENGEGARMQMVVYGS